MASVKDLPSRSSRAFLIPFPDLNDHRQSRLSTSEHATTSDLLYEYAVPLPYRKAIV